MEVLSFIAIGKSPDDVFVGHVDSFHQAYCRWFCLFPQLTLVLLNEDGLSPELRKPHSSG